MPIILANNQTIAVSNTTANTDVINTVGVVTTNANVTAQIVTSPTPVVVTTNVAPIVIPELQVDIPPTIEDTIPSSATIHVVTAAQIAEGTVLDERIKTPGVNSVQEGTGGKSGTAYIETLVAG